jgi:predicted phosphoribosyltransferase
MGAIMDSPEPITVRNEQIVRLAQVSAAEFDILRQQELAEIERRRRFYLGERPVQDVFGRVAIIVDDGIATGATMLAAIRGLRQRKPDKIIIAVPVTPSDELPRLRAADDVVCLQIPHVFEAVGSQYENFPQLTDAEVIELIERC